MNSTFSAPKSKHKQNFPLKECEATKKSSQIITLNCTKGRGKAYLTCLMFSRCQKRRRTRPNNKEYKLECVERRDMELNNNLTDLIHRTCLSHDRINERIHHESVSFCKHCFEQHGLVCGIAETTVEVEERERLIPVRDSLKDVQDTLVSLQTKESINQEHVNAAFGRLETSRLLLLEEIRQYPGQGRKVDVLEELNNWFGEGQTAFTWKFKQRKKKDVVVKTGNGMFGSAIGCIWSLFKPRNWFNSGRMAIILVVVSAGISATLNAYNGVRQPNFGSRSKIVLYEDGKLAGKQTYSSQRDENSTAQIDVSCGRG